jgi:two-component system chemotaxis response regulator CheB
MCSSLTAAGASHTLDALAFGASDYVTKPSSHGANTREVVGEELIQKIKSLTSNGQETHQSAASATSATPSALSSQAQSVTPPNVIAIGVSTGGPVALQELLPHLPSQLNVPIFIVQHMPPVFTKLLAERLSAHSKMPVVEAKDGEEVKPGTIYLAPGGLHMEVRKKFGKTSVALNEGPLENSCRPAVDVLFRSVATVYGASTLAVMLTGMGQDGLLGCQRIKEVGGTVLAQDRASSAVWGMPGAVAEAGLADAVVPLTALPSHIKALVARAAQGAQQREHRV